MPLELWNLKVAVSRLSGSFCLSMLITHPFSLWIDADPYQFPPFYGNRSDIS